MMNEITENRLVMLGIKEIPLKYQGLTEHAVRRWVNSGELPSIRTGKKILIAESVLCEFLLKENNQRNQEQMHKEMNNANESLKNFSNEDLINELCNRGAERGKSNLYGEYLLRRRYSPTYDEIDGDFLILINLTDNQAELVQEDK